MTICKECNGKGFLTAGERECPSCKGIGKAKSISLEKLSEKEIGKILEGGIACVTCEGRGVVPLTKKCNACDGEGETYTCLVCGKEILGKELCDSCAKKPLVHALSQACDTRDLEVGKIYEGTVDDIADFGAFLNLNSRVRGLVYSRNLSAQPKVGEKMFVEVKNISGKGNIELVPRHLSEHHLIEVEKELPRRKTTELKGFVGRLVQIAGEVIQIRQTGGPTVFLVSDEEGIVKCAAFEKAGERAYPEISSEMMVRVIGEVSLRSRGAGSEVEIEVREIKQLWGGEATSIKEEIERAIEERSEPEEIPFLVESEVLGRLKPAMRKVAKQLCKAVYKSRPIIVRHHWDADGITSAVAIERALLPLIREVGGSEAEHYFYKRSPSKAPFYELEDVTKDLTFALEDQTRHGQKMPLILLMDNGSTEEDLPAVKHALVYGVDVLVVDHHHPDGTVDPYLLGHVNPAHAGGDFGITTGMLGTEIARMINPGVTEEIKHLPAISAVGDRSEAREAAQYKALVEEKYSLEDLRSIALALDYEAFWQRFNDGRGIINDILNLCRLDRHRAIVALLCEQANAAIKEQLEASLPNIKTQKLSNGVILNVIDLESYAHKFTFPPPGKTSGEIHDRLCNRYPGQPVVTIGYGPDFAVLRSRGVKMNIPKIVKELRGEIQGGGVSGGGHLLVGSIKYVEGMKKEVLAKLAEKIARTEAEAKIETLG